GSACGSGRRLPDYRGRPAGPRARRLFRQFQHAGSKVMTIERKEQGFVFTGWHMAGVMVLFFGTIITVNLIMAWNASNSWSGLVVPNTYVASQQFNGKVAEARALAASGIEGELTVEEGRVAYRVTDAGGVPLAADDVSAVFKRPVDERKDFTVALEPAGE